MYLRDLVDLPSIGFLCLLLAFIMGDRTVEGRNLREANKKFSMLTRNERFSYSNGGYNNNRQYNNGYDYNMGSSGNLGSGDSNYDNYGISRSSSNNYDSFGNTRKTSDFRYLGNSDSNSNWRRDVDSSLYSAGSDNRNNYGWNAHENM